MCTVQEGSVLQKRWEVWLFVQIHCTRLLPCGVPRALCYIPHLRINAPSSVSPRNSLCWFNCYFSSDTGCTYPWTQMFIATNSQKLERIQCPSTMWINELQHIHTMKYYSALKRNALQLNAITQEKTKRSCFSGNTSLSPKHQLGGDRRN